MQALGANPVLSYVNDFGGQVALVLIVMVRIARSIPKIQGLIRAMCGHFRIDLTNQHPEWRWRSMLKIMAIAPRCHIEQQFPF